MFDPYLHHPLVADASVDNYQVILPMNLVVNAVILTEFVKPSSGLDTEPEPSLIYYKTEPAKEGTNEEASDPEQSGNSEEKENTSENVQSTVTGNFQKDEFLKGWSTTLPNSQFHNFTSSQFYKFTIHIYPKISHSSEKEYSIRI